MSDLISRQAAIDDLYGKDPSKLWDTADIEVWINEMPPAQPDVPDTNVGDMISRQMAIEALERDEEYNADIPNRADGVRDAIITISSLPSAEPKVNEAGDLISREYMKSLGGACIAQRLKNGDLCPIISIDLLPSAEPEQKCESCRYHNLEWDDEPCDSCTMGGEGCHYKPERKKV